MTRSFVVTGGAHGIGLAIVRRLEREGAVVPVDLAGSDHRHAVTGDAADPAVVEQAADLAERLGTLTGWVNNAAIFRDASLHESSPGDVLDLIRANLAPAVVGSAVAVRRFLAAGTPGSIVNVSSHQARRAVRGALPYATAKAAIEGLTRATAVDYGRHGIRANAVALGSISTERSESMLAGQDDDTRARTAAQLAALHPLGRIGRAEEVAGVVAYLLSTQASFVSGTVVPVDGGRSAQGLDPEAS